MRTNKLSGFAAIEVLMVVVVVAVIGGLSIALFGGRFLIGSSSTPAATVTFETPVVQPIVRLASAYPRA